LQRHAKRNSPIKKISHPAEIINFTVRVPLKKVVRRIEREGRNIYANISYDSEYGIKDGEEIDNII